MIPSGTPASRSAEPSAAGCHGVRDRNIPAIRGPELVVAAEAISERAPRSSVRCSRRKNSLQGPREFPAIFHRKFCCNPLILVAEMESLTCQFPRNRRDSLLFSLLAGNQAGETRSHATAYTTTRSGGSGDFLKCRGRRPIGREFVRPDGLRNWPRSISRSFRLLVSRHGNPFPRNARGASRD